MMFTNMHLHTLLSFDSLLVWFYQSNFDFLMLYASDFSGDDNELVSNLISQRQIYNEITGEHICLIYFLPDKYFRRDARFLYVESDARHPWESNRYHYCDRDTNFFSEEKYRRNGGMDISATYRASEEICRYFTIPNNNLPAFVIIPKSNFSTGLIQRAVFPLKNIGDIEKFFNTLSFLNGYKKTIENFRLKDEGLKEEFEKIQTVPQRIQQLNESIADLSEQITAQQTTLLAKQQEILHLLSNYIAWPSDVPVAPDSINGLLATRKCKGKFFQSAPNSECFRLYRNEFKKLRKLKAALAGSQLVVNQLKNTQFQASLQQSISTAREEIASEISNFHSEYLQTLQRRYLLSEKEAQDILHELRHSPDWLSFQCFKILIDNLKNRITIITIECQNLEEKIERIGFDTFISCSSKDYREAEQLKDYLENRGLHPFLASISLREIGESHYGMVIRRVLEICKYFILFATDNEYISGSYVYHEWNAFIEDEYRGRYQNRKIVPVIRNVRTGDQLPLALRNLEMFSTDTYEQDGLAEFLLKNKEI